MALIVPPLLVHKSALVTLVTARFVEVACCSDVLPVAVREPALTVPIVAVFANKLVDVAVVAVVYVDDAYGVVIPCAVPAVTKRVPS